MVISTTTFLVSAYPNQLAMDFIMPGCSRSVSISQRPRTHGGEVRVSSLRRTDDVRFTKTKSFHPALNLVPIKAGIGEEQGIAALKVSPQRFIGKRNRNNDFHWNS